MQTPIAGRLRTAVATPGRLAHKLLMQFGTIRPFLDKLRRQLPWRSAIARRLESLAEIWFWRRCPGDAAKLQKYRLLRSRPLLFQINPKVDVLRVAGWFRFGNSVIQLRNVIYVAERWGARAIEASEIHRILLARALVKLPSRGA